MALASLDQHPFGVTWVVDEPMARSSHALVDKGRVWLIDPTDEPEALDRALELGRPVAVLQLLDRHGRDCTAIAAGLGVPHVTVPSVLVDTPFTIVPVVDNRLWREVALWWPAQGLLVGNSFYLLWMILGFLVVSSVLIVSLGRLGDMFGRVRVFNLGFVRLVVARSQIRAPGIDRARGFAGVARGPRGGARRDCCGVDRCRPSGARVASGRLGPTPPARLVGQPGAR